MSDMLMDPTSAGPESTTAPPQQQDHGGLQDPLSKGGGGTQAKGGNGGGAQKGSNKSGGSTPSKPGGGEGPGSKPSGSDPKLSNAPVKSTGDAPKKATAPKPQDTAPKPEEKPPGLPPGSPGGEGIKKGIDLSGAKVENKQSFEIKLAVPVGYGFSVEVEAKAEIEHAQGVGSKQQLLDPKESNKSKTTKIGAEVKIGFSWGIAFFKIGARFFGTLEAEMPGELNPVNALKLAASEFVRWRVSDQVKDVGEKLKKIDPIVAKREQSIAGSYDEVIGILQDGKRTQAKKIKDVKEATQTENSFINPFRTPMENVRKESEKLASELQSAAGISKLDEAKMAADYFIDSAAMVEGMKQIGEAADNGGSIQSLIGIANSHKGKALAAVSGAKDKASESVNALDFKTPTPGVKVSGSIGGEIFAGFSFGSAAKLELSVGGGMKFDTAKTKTETDSKGNNKEVFDKKWEGIAKAAVKFELAGFGLEAELTYSGGKLEGKLEGSTPEFPFPLAPGDIKFLIETVQANAVAFGLATSAEAESPKTKKEPKGFLATAAAKLKSAYAPIKPAVEAIKKNRSLIGKVVERTKKLPLTGIELGASFEIGGGEKSGTVFVGLKQSVDADLDFGGVGIEVAKSTSERLVLPWTA